MNKKTDLPISCQLLANVNAGGIQKESVDIIRALVKAGARVSVCSDGGLLLHDMLRTGATHRLMPIGNRNPARILVNWLKIWRLTGQQKATLLHLRSPELGLIAGLLLRTRRLRLIATVHRTAFDSKRENRRFTKLLGKCEKIIAVSAYVAAQLAGMGVEKERIVLIPRGIDLSRFDPKAIRTHRLIELAATWRLPDGVPLMIVPSRISPNGGQAFLIEALARMKDDPGTKDLAFTCLLLGDEAVNPAYRQALEKLIITHGLEGRVRFVGFCDDMPAAYALADIVITPALAPEPFGRVTVEAQAMGRLVVCAGHGAALETVVPGVTGKLFKPGDSDDLIACLKHALALTTAERAAIGLAARDHVAKHYPALRMCNDTIALYAALQASPNTPVSQ